jgi:hypothetical protein
MSKRPRTSWVKLAWSDGTMTRFQAHVVGLWCVHEVPWGSTVVPGYRVSDVATGRYIPGADGISFADALEVATKLNELGVAPEFWDRDMLCVAEAILGEVLDADREKRR